MFAIHLSIHTHTHTYITQGDPIAMLLHSVGVRPLFVVVTEKIAEVFSDKD